MALGALGGAAVATGSTAAPTTTTTTTTTTTRASFAARGRRQSEAPTRKRSSVALKRHAWTLKYHDFVPDTLDFGAGRGFASSKPEKFQ